MATNGPVDEKELERNHESPNNMDEKIDPETLRNERQLNVDAIPDPDAGLSEEERAKRVNLTSSRILLINSNGD
jgi:hypothetical protein